MNGPEPKVTVVVVEVGTQVTRTLSIAAPCALSGKKPSPLYVLVNWSVVLLPVAVNVKVVGVQPMLVFDFPTVLKVYEVVVAPAETSNVLTPCGSPGFPARSNVTV